MKFEKNYSNWGNIYFLVNQVLIHSILALLAELKLGLLGAVVGGTFGHRATFHAGIFLAVAGTIGTQLEVVVLHVLGLAVFVGTQIVLAIGRYRPCFSKLHSAERWRATVSAASARVLHKVAAGAPSQPVILHVPVFVVTEPTVGVVAPCIWSKVSSAEQHPTLLALLAGTFHESPTCTLRQVVRRLIGSLVVTEIAFRTVIAGVSVSKVEPAKGSPVAHRRRSFWFTHLLWVIEMEQTTSRRTKTADEEKVHYWGREM